MDRGHDESLCGGGGAVVEVGVVWMMRVCVEGVGLLLRWGLYGWTEGMMRV